MKVIKISLLVSVFAVLSSCTFLRYVQGTVIDAETQMPIDKVIIRNVDDNCLDMPVDTECFIHSDSLGNFEIFSPTAGLFICPKISLSFEKEGYNKVIKKYRNWNGNAVILLEKQAK
jgi:hypothetical protein